MNTSAVVLVSIVLSAAAAAGVSIALRPGDPPPDTAIPDLQRAVADLRTANASLLQQVEQLRRAPAPVVAPRAERSEAATVSPEQVAAAVDAYLKKLGPDAALAAGKGDAKPAYDLDAEFGKLKEATFFEDSARWKRLVDAGKADEALAKFEALAAANPKDVQAQMDLANAYLSVLQLSEDKGPLAMKSDLALDRVLELDEHHWPARFTKAMSYTFWPDFTGKPQEAIGHFEKLVAQQESMPVEEDHAQTYLFLGNLLASRDPAKAKEVWQKGLRRHPQNAELTKKLAQ